MLDAVGGGSMGTGPDACFKAAAEKLGADAKVSDVTALYSPGPEVDPSATEPAGTVMSCTVYYQDPDNPLKLLGIVYNNAAMGGFSQPAPVEVSVSGDAADFKLDDMLVPLSGINASGLADVMAANKAKLDERYSAHGLTMVQLVGPSSFRDGFALRVQYDGRLKSNDVKEDGSATIALDGKTVLDGDFSK